MARVGSSLLTAPATEVIRDAELDLVTWSPEQQFTTYVDVTVRHPCCPHLVRKAAMMNDVAALSGESDKRKRYPPKGSTVVTPFALETYGRLGPAAEEFLRTLATAAERRDALRAVPPKARIQTWYTQLSRVLARAAARTILEARGAYTRHPRGAADAAEHSPTQPAGPMEACSRATLLAAAASNRATVLRMRLLAAAACRPSTSTNRPDLRRPPGLAGALARLTSPHGADYAAADAPAMPAKASAANATLTAHTAEGQAMTSHLVPGGQPQAVDLHVQGLIFADVALEHRVGAQPVQTSTSSSDRADCGSC